MTERILEKNGVDNTNIDGAGFNRFCAGNRDGILRGILNECAASIQGNAFTLSTGELLICGFRVVVESPIVKTFTTTPTSAVIYQLVGEIQVNSSSEVQFTLKFQEVQQLTQDPLFDTLTGQGTYQAEICRFTQETNGNLSTLITTMNVISGGAGTKGSIIIGTVTTNTLPAGSQASVDVDEREEDGVVFTDFIFWIPQGATGADGTHVFQSIADYIEDQNDYYLNDLIIPDNLTPRSGDVVLFHNVYYAVILSVSTDETHRIFNIAEAVSFRGKDAIGEVKSIKINGTVYTPDSNGLVDLGEISSGGTYVSPYNDIY